MEHRLLSSDQVTYSSSPLVAPLAHFGRDDIPLAGGKGANLGELTRAGFAVPPGFVITTAAYDLLLAFDGLHTRLADLIDVLDPGSGDSLAQGSRALRQLLVQARIPQEIETAILAAYHQLGSHAVAVRSSATAEDLPGMAFAGQQETSLNVLTEIALLDAVCSCWASLWSERAVAYRVRQGIPQSSVKLAVVVQQMAPADIAGVMLTANPVSGARDEMVIDANPGLGEAVVAGLVTPDHFVIDRRRMRIKEQHLGKREVIIRPKAEGGTEQIALSTTGSFPLALSSSSVRQLAQLGSAIERHYAAPQDIEWAWVKNETKNGQFLILQARPMTALPEPLPVKITGPMRMVFPLLAEMWPMRPYPLDMTTFTGVLERAVGNFLVLMLGKSAPDPDKAFFEEDGVIVRFQPPQVHLSPGMLITPWLTLWRKRHYDPARWESDPLLADVIKQAGELAQRDPASFTWAQNIAAIHAALALIPRVMRLREYYLPQAILGLGSLWLQLKLARRSNCIGTLLGGIETKTTETNRALHSLAAQIRGDPLLLDRFTHSPAKELPSVLASLPAGRDFLASFEAFLAQYGHRETALTISQGSWKDQPQIVLAILKVQVATPPQDPESYQAWKRTRDELLSHSILGKRPIRKMFLKALANARALLQIREDTHFYATMALPPVRHTALELGRRLNEAVVLDNADEVLHLNLEELESLGQSWPPSQSECEQIRGLVAQRGAKRQALAGVPMVDPRLLAFSSPVNQAEDVLLSGAPGSPGTASGPARIVHDSSEFEKLQPGDVLVAPLTNPAWTPLFQHAVAVVVDAGGAASHAAIVAREYGVPAVMGTLNGTQKLVDGQWVRVDGSRGLVLKGDESK